MARTLTLPLKVAADGQMASITQDHPAEIAQSLALLLATRVGERRVNPDYGLPDPTFDVVSSELIETAAAEWEPRADIAAIDTAAAGQPTRVHLEEA